MTAAWQFAMDFLAAFLIWKIIGFCLALVWAGFLYRSERKGRHMTEATALEIAARYEKEIL